MASLPPVPNVVRLEFKYSVGLDVTSGSRIYFLYSGSVPTDPQFGSWGSAIAQALNDHIVPVMSTSIQVTEIRMTDLGSNTGADLTVNTANAGQRVGVLLPASACALINYSIKRRYRGGKPRTYWPMGVDTDLANPQEWSSVARTTFTSTWSAFLGAVIAGAAGAPNITTLCNVSYYESVPTGSFDPSGKPIMRQELRPNPVVDPILGTSVNPILGSQRRRYGR